MALSREAPSVLPEGFTQLLPATLQVPAVVGPHICTIEITLEDILEILPTTNYVSRQVVQRGPSRVG
jgi:hypothetical protein